MAAPTSRPRAKPMGNEEAGAVLNLGEFEDTPCLSLSEARVLIESITTARRQVEGPNAPRPTETLNKTVDYLDLFARFKDEEVVLQVERILRSTSGLEAFERSQLGTLCCEDADEAKTLIPSLANKISDEDLDSLLQQIQDIRRAAQANQ